MLKKKSKRMLKSMMFTVIAIVSLFGITAYADNISVYVDNNIMQLKDANEKNVYPFIQNGTTYVPLRGVSEALDCDVIWDGNNKTILI